MRIIVTGGAGFIGSALVHALLDQKDEVLIVDDLSTGSMENLHPWAGFRKMDIRDEALRDVFIEFAPDAVVNLAAQVSVTASIQDPELDWDINVNGTRAVAKAAREAGAKRVITASSAAVYGENPDLPLTEKSTCEPIAPYGRSKLESESVLADELADSSVDYAAFRFSNVYGPRQSSEGEGGVVAIFCDRIVRGEAPVIFGDGSQTRDYVFVADVAGAIIDALHSSSPLARKDGFAYNISTGERISLENMLVNIRAASMFMGQSEYKPAREGDIHDSELDPTRAKEVFGWEAKADLKTGIELTWRWFETQAPRQN